MEWYKLDEERAAKLKALLVAIDDLVMDTGIEGSDALAPDLEAGIIQVIPAASRALALIKDRWK